LRRERVQRYQCRVCSRTFCPTTGRLGYRDKRPDLNRKVFELICSGMSQRRIAVKLGTKPATVARKVTRLASHCRAKHRIAMRGKKPVKELMFDEMESFVHTKCKPTSIVVVVEPNTREILKMRACVMPAKGLLAAISRKKYGPRPDHRMRTLRAVMKVLKPWVNEATVMKSDQCPRYPAVLRAYHPKNEHQQFEGRRGCVVGQGELKRGGFDPLFALNHTCAMARDNIKRLARRTWCTTKRLRMFQCILDIYTWFHNQLVVHPRKLPQLGRAVLVGLCQQ